MMPERDTWPLWKCLNAKSLAQFIQDVWDKYGIDLLKEDKLGPSVTYKGQIESLEEIDKLIRQKPKYREVKW